LLKKRGDGPGEKQESRRCRDPQSLKIRTQRGTGPFGNKVARFYEKNISEGKEKREDDSNIREIMGTWS